MNEASDAMARSGVAAAIAATSLDESLPGGLLEAFWLVYGERLVADGSSTPVNLSDLPHSVIVAIAELLTGLVVAMRRLAELEVTGLTEVVHELVTCAHEETV